MKQLGWKTAPIWGQIRASPWQFHLWMENNVQEQQPGTEKKIWCKRSTSLLHPSQDNHAILKQAIAILVRECVLTQFASQEQKILTSYLHRESQSVLSRSLGIPETHLGVCEIRTIFHNLNKMLLSFSSPFFHKCTVGFSIGCMISDSTTNCRCRYEMPDVLYWAMYQSGL